MLYIIFTFGSNLLTFCKMEYCGYLSDRRQILISKGGIHCQEINGF